MNNHSILIGLFFILLALFAWAFRTLPGENWQILGVIPGRKQTDGSWSGLNLTYYGLFIALSVMWAVAVCLLLLAAVGAPLMMMVAALSAMLMICIPASRLIARWVEKKPHTASVGAAAYLGMVITPLVLDVMARLFHSTFPLSVGMAAFSVAYAFGEGIGRLACISFGCCYGKPMDHIPDIIRNFFLERHFIYQGKTKKISYADQLDGRKIFPVQAVTATLYSGAGLLGMFLFAHGHFISAFLCTQSIIQIWRFCSEFLRADFRGKGKISAYQIMALISLPYAVFLSTLLSESIGITAPDLFAGLKRLWDPWVLVFLQGLGLLTFWFTGRSQVTGSDIHIFIHPEKIK